MPWNHLEYFNFVKSKVSKIGSENKPETGLLKSLNVVIKTFISTYRWSLKKYF